MYEVVIEKNLISLCHQDQGSWVLQRGQLDKVGLNPLNGLFGLAWLGLLARIRFFLALAFVTMGRGHGPSEDNLTKLA